MTNKKLMNMLFLQKKYADCVSDLERMHVNWENEEDLHFTEGQLLTAIFVLSRISKDLSSKIDFEI